MAYLSKSKGPQRLLSNTALWIVKKPAKKRPSKVTKAAKSYLKSRKKG